jgi:hypothetical protein
VASLISSSRGDIQQLQKDAAMHCGMTVAFARRLNWLHVASVLDSYTKRLSFGVRDDLLQLVRIGVDMPAFRARAFYGSGLRSAEDISRAPVGDVIRVLVDCMPFDDNKPLEVIKISSKLVQQEPRSVDAGVNIKALENEITPVEMVYEHLAKKIIASAKLLLAKELDLRITR